MRIGIIGTGRIAKRFVPEAAIKGLDITAVYNPHEESVRNFVAALWQTGDSSQTGAASDRHISTDTDTVSLDTADAAKTKAPRGYFDLTDFWDAVDSVYIASPHETHADYIRRALENGKHVLCEKPMVLEKEQALQCFRTARDRNLVLMEGLKTAYCPGYRKLLEIAKSGVIGVIRLIDACFTKLEDPGKRELTDVRYGGSFTELGSYVLLPVYDLLEAACEPGSQEVSETPQPCRVAPAFSSLSADNGLDLFTRVTFRYPEAMATVTCGLGVKAEGRLLIAGTKGYIVVPAPWWKTTQFEVHFEDPSKVLRYEEPFVGDGLRYELEEFITRCVSAKTECRDHDENRSIFMAEMMERRNI